MFKKGDIVTRADLKDGILNDLYVFDGYEDTNFEDEEGDLFMSGTDCCSILLEHGHLKNLYFYYSSTKLWYAEGRHILTEVTRRGFYEI